ncbi:ribonuclease P protein component [Polynucleobacter kasalickyi]|uniref:Ribonuclease P protein component n=2 Tax=Polynucleobacter kasalickyi TaxID=1938817 RepID=A0A1W2BS91_9BURK|nr:ribonuclease P protein component [Polynucleobacter kasalickyi]
MPGPKTSHLSFHLKESIEQENSRLGLAIPKKKARRAIDRNRIKRLIRENFRKASISPNTDIVVKLNRAVGQQTRGRLREKERVAIRKQIQQHFHSSFE